MTFRAEFKKYSLDFINPMGTSRGVLRQRDIYILCISYGDVVGFGECSPLKGLSPESDPEFENKLSQVCDSIDNGIMPADEDLLDWPSIRFAVESAFLDIERGGKQQLFDSDFTKGVKNLPTNGLVVMESIENMYRQVVAKIDAGFRCIKIKVGALDFNAECRLISRIREQFPAGEIALRLDANGAFADEEALTKLETLAPFSIHSIEQPVKPRHWDAMAFLCRESPIPVAWDEELIGITDVDEKTALVEAFRPAFLILKPTLLGGLKACEEWIDIAGKFDVGFWVTSALESNIGLNIISQWAATLDVSIPQGLGTGQLFTRNFQSPLSLQNGYLHYSPEKFAASSTVQDKLQLR